MAALCFSPQARPVRATVGKPRHTFGVTPAAGIAPGHVRSAGIRTSDAAPAAWPVEAPACALPPAGAALRIAAVPCLQAGDAVPLWPHAAALHPLVVLRLSGLPLLSSAALAAGVAELQSREALGTCLIGVALGGVLGLGLYGWGAGRAPGPGGAARTQQHVHAHAVTGLVGAALLSATHVGPDGPLESLGICTLVRLGFALGMLGPTRLLDPCLQRCGPRSLRRQLPAAARAERCMHVPADLFGTIAEALGAELSAVLWALVLLGARRA